MAFPRSSGVLLHPTSLPGRFGIGDLGPSAHTFVDFLADAGQRLWQVLPLGPTGYGESPYQSLSAFAGNPLLVSLERLADAGWLTADEFDAGLRPASARIDYESLAAHRDSVWPRVLDRLEADAASAHRERFERFCRTEATWLDDYALFMAVKAAHGHRAWTSWDHAVAHREPDTLARWRVRLAREVRVHQLTQFLFFEQWQELRVHCRQRGVEIVGDIPIFVAHDSADVWTHRGLFRLDPDGAPSVVAGVPPDYFSATGQLWGNPHYDWTAIARTGFAWWIDRVRALLTMVDRIRLDHFRGFVAAWEVRRGETTAMHGEWKPGPGAALFDALRDALDRSPLPFIAENLGVITPEVEALRHRYALPGMAILQFAFGTDPQAPSFRPHNLERNLAVYTGTHDNDTTAGWWSGNAGHSTRSIEDVEREREFARRYLRIGNEVHWDLIRAAWASVADTAIAPAQDLLGLGNDARMNQPGEASGNWRWRLLPDQLTPAIAERLASLTRTFER
jgi:4-alpha-glucanotransferase